MDDNMSAEEYESVCVRDDATEQNYLPLQTINCKFEYTYRSSELPSKRRHWKNLFGLAISFMCTITAFQSLQSLQSSLHYDKGLGLASLCVLYSSMIISTLLAPVFIRTLGTKLTIATCLVCFSPYTASNFYPEFYTLIPTAALLGFAAGPLWVAQSTYLTTLAFSLANVVNDCPETVINQFNGMFYFFFYTTQIWGNLLSSVIFSVNTTKEYLNRTALWKCGSNGSSGEEGTDYQNPGEHKTHLLLGIYLFLGLLGPIVAVLFMDKIRLNFPTTPDTKYYANQLLEVIRLMGNSTIALLIPFMIFSGFEQAYVIGDFTKSFVTCTIGVRNVGYVMIAFGVTNAISAFCIGRMEAYIGRKLIFTAGGTVNFVIIVWMLLWRAPEGSLHQSYQLYLMAMGWGVSDAIWMTQITCQRYFAYVKEMYVSNQLQVT